MRQVLAQLLADDQNENAMFGYARYKSARYVHVDLD